MPKWFVGKDLTSLTIVGGVENPATNVIAYGTASSLADSVDYISFDAMQTADVIVPVNATKVHNEPLLLDSGCAVGAIKKRTGSVLAHVANAFTYAKVTAVTADGVTYIFEGMWSRMGDGVKSVGKNTTELTLLPIDKDGVGGLSRTEA